MQKKFIANLGFLLLLNLLVKPFWLFGIDRAVQNATGAEAYGQYYALFNFSLLLNILLDLGITNFNNRNISMNRHLLQKHMSGIITLRLLLAVIYIGISILAAFAIGYGINESVMLLILLFNQVLISGILYLRSNLAGMHMFRLDSIVSVLDRGIMIIVCAWLLWGNGTPDSFRIEWFVWAQTASYLITLIVTLVMLYGKVKFIALRWNKAFSLMIIRKSFPFAVLILLMTFYNRVDSVMLERLLVDGDTQAGIYAQSYRVMEAGNMVAFLFAGLLLPIFSAMIKQKEDIGPLLKTSCSLLVTPAIAIASIFFFCSEELMSALYKYNAKESALVTPLLMTSFIMISSSYIFGTLLTANGKLKTLNILAAIGMLLNIVLNFIFIPKWGAVGAAISSLVTQTTLAISQIWLCKVEFRIKVNWIFLNRMLLYTLSCVSIMYFLSKRLTISNEPMINCAIMAICAFICALVFKVISWAELTSITLKKQH